MSANAATVQLIAQDQLLEFFAQALNDLGSSKLRTAEMRAVNHVGDKAMTAVRRALVRQTSMSRTIIDQGLDRHATGANDDPMTYRITASGRATALGEFNPSQFSYGVRAKVWGRLQQFPSTFIVAKYGGNVFKRVGKSRLPIEKLYGPSLPSELVKDESLVAFNETAKELQPRVEHEIERLLPKQP